jgi:hypothetical protein
MRLPKQINSAGFKTIEINNKTTTSSLDSLLGNSTLHTKYITAIESLKLHSYKYKGLYDMCSMERLVSALFLVYFLDSVFSIKNFFSLEARDRKGK